MSQRTSCAHKSVIVTGGGTGIGAACASMLAAEGASVTICGRTESKLVAIADSITAAGGTVQYVVADVTAEDDVARLVGAAVDAYGGLHGFVANAGGGGMLAPYHLINADEFLRVLHLNVLGTMLSVKHSVPHLAKTRGSFIGMSSLAGHVTHPHFGAYTVGKAGIQAMMRNAADEYGAVGIRFNTIQPGFITTEIMEGIPRESPVYASYIDNTPLADVGEPEDIAHLARFLISDESKWINGQEIAVDGGNSLRRGPDYSSFAAMLSGGQPLLPPTE